MAVERIDSAVKTVQTGYEIMQANGRVQSLSGLDRIIGPIMNMLTLEQQRDLGAEIRRSGDVVQDIINNDTGAVVSVSLADIFDPPQERIQ